MAVAIETANKVQERAAMIQAEIMRVQANKRQRKDMIDHEYHEGVIEPGMNRQLSVSPSGQIWAL
jgi:hypothetical protein